MKYDRIWNFNAGPAAVPLEVLEKVHEEWFNCRGTGMALLEWSHRGKEYDAYHNNVVALVKKILGLDDSFHVLFLQGGASLQFAMIPMNFLLPGRTADYINTGTWASKAIKEAKPLGSVNVAFDGKVENYMRLPHQDEMKLSEDPCYFHCTSNNTIKGTQWFTFPDVGNTPIVCDMSSDIMSHEIDASKFSLIYAGAQKNLGPSGVTLVIIRDDFYKTARTGMPTMLEYKTHVDENSMYNTCPTFAIYFMGLVLEWILENGGLKGMEARNRAKAETLYGFMDAHSDFYRGPVDKGSRSWMNICMRLPSEELEDKFVKEAKAAKMVGIKGHRSVGGIRFSCYNAVPPEAVDAAVAFMKEFMAKNG